MSIHSHTKKALRRNISQLRSQCAKLVEKFFGTVGAEPSFEDLQMLRIRPDLFKGNLMRTPSALNLFAVNHFGSGPSLWGAKDQHGPHRSGRVFPVAGFPLDATNFLVDVVEGGRHRLMH